MPGHPLLRFLHPPLGEGVPDHELARRYAGTGDEAAFELLVRRHADTVWGACRQVLRDHQAAEDAFQAAFLALARKAKSIRTPCVAGWLYRVTIRIALQLRTAPARETTERSAPTDDPDRAEIAAAIHEEVARLAEKYRLPVVLCDLSGLTHAEAAARLGWPVGTVSGRLSLAREQLRSRLNRRGVYAPAVLTTLAVGSVATAQVRTAVTNATGDTVPPAISALTDGALSAMHWNKPLLISALAVLVCAVITTAVVVGQEKTKPAPAGTEPPGLTAAQLQEKEKAAMDAMKGTWLLQKTFMDGKEQDNQFEYWRWHFDGRDVKSEYKMLDGTTHEGSSTVTINPTTNPPEMNVYNKESLLLAIYHQDGDRLKIAILGRSEVERPRSFDPKDKRVRGMPLIIWELKKRK
ncbi:sigma-70 family rna polymerase sigma factor : RNA polymerase sigma factor, sigma-70 family OS=Singulisphaera acidiphila (strain ATCC BAA-1392 / DSM 18658 / VKM B-2454 / MOB10) GN=Sinac_5383 PE=4 SV=1: Sigma70_r2: Sigma70_r4_2 [Gemmata massiliana]|uniref:Uncharacterized protein n=1 Tax=Gemmata massiliana TaxID=1210884 RepID=A0A6P2CW13_9BACT|nr:sigma-70 family RNA polymerase sigma factor [Gemmata massiliana]VTR91360.1 sigma-70 family rna polymerase sigma factor : RNA polymerase sigma factor, sigma-70 family OS=Singulisphaera acidiphila (strain ATCC BAA-1392 / DSM 18658 / VKM B-2454 / MOB10) GN=Sinac_5383 PE=4 SV=1: Sigma70_r2: Sigma70_r4_2 [Gemmata massiliana]